MNGTYPGPQLLNPKFVTKKEERDYLETLKQLQKGGQIGSLGMGTIDLDKIQNHLQRGTATPSATETRIIQKDADHQYTFASNQDKH